MAVFEIDQESFRKTRRNLLVVSVFEAFIILAGVQIKKINLLGVTATVDRPSTIYLFIFIVWLYYLTSYLQNLYLHKINVVEEFTDAIDEHGKAKSLISIFFIYSSIFSYYFFPIFIGISPVICLFWFCEEHTIFSGLMLMVLVCFKSFEELLSWKS